MLRYTGIYQKRAVVLRSCEIQDDPVNRRKAIEQILKGKLVTCSLVAPTIQRQYFTSESTPDRSHLLEMGPSSEVESQKLTRNIEPAELSRRLLRMSYTAPGPHQVRYYDLKRTDPGCVILSDVYNWCLSVKRIPADWKESVTVLLQKIKRWPVEPFHLAPTIVGKRCCQAVCGRLGRPHYRVGDGKHLSPE